MSVGADIKEVKEEVGTPFTIYPYGASAITGEYLDYETSFDSSTEFIRQFTLSASFSYDTAASVGDIIQIGTGYYLLMNLVPERFEGSVVEYGAFLVMCNCYGKFMRKSLSGRDSKYHLSDSWGNIATLVRGLMYENARGGVDAEIGGVMKVPVIDQVLYTQAISTIKVGDRWLPDYTDTSTYYKVVNILKNKYSGLYYYILETDTRE